MSEFDYYDAEVTREMESKEFEDIVSLKDEIDKFWNCANELDGMIFHLKDPCLDDLLSHIDAVLGAAMLLRQKSESYR